ncbi:MAG: hypothetical protein FWG09_08055, partial [Synergistaceae bacterium]|nr:hypothetical protein [Synergistaceae bacterium]
DEEALYDFVQKEFVSNDGTVITAAIHKFNRSSAYEIYDSGTDSSTFVSVKDAGKKGGDDGGGCSGLSVGVIALFLLPAFFVKRGKKQ